jgi:hypothetical protein
MSPLLLKQCVICCIQVVPLLGNVVIIISEGFGLKLLQVLIVSTLKNFSIFSRNSNGDFARFNSIELLKTLVH